jgi:hypothetical protein
MQYATSFNALHLILAQMGLTPLTETLALVEAKHPEVDIWFTVRRRLGRDTAKWAGKCSCTPEAQRLAMGSSLGDSECATRP